MEPSELTTVSMLLLRFARVFFNKLLAISIPDGPAGEFSSSYRRSSWLIWSVSLEDLGFPFSSVSCHFPAIFVGIVDTVVVKPFLHILSYLKQTAYSFLYRRTNLLNCFPFLLISILE